MSQTRQKQGQKPAHVFVLVQILYCTIQYNEDTKDVDSGKGGAQARGLGICSCQAAASWPHFTQCCSLDTTVGKS